MAEVAQRQWYVVYSKPAREAQAYSHLAQKGLEVFFPQLQLPARAPVHRTLVPLFPNYLFVRLWMPDDYYAVVWCPGVRRLVSFNDTPAPVDDTVVLDEKGRLFFLYPIGLMQESKKRDGALS